MATPAGAEPALVQAEALTPFFEALEVEGRGRPVHILQLGDSHTVGDLITSSLRSRLQARFGRGGRGAIPAGRPYAGYQPRQIEVIETDGFSRTAPPGQGTGPGPGTWPANGLSGTRGLMGGGGRLDMTAEPAAAFSRVVVCGAGSGSVVLEVDGAAHELAFGAPACPDVILTAPARALTLRPGRGAAEVHSIATFAVEGLALSNLGVIGATLADLAARDEAIAAAELAAWTPDLILVAFGTNEGFDPGLDLTRYEALLRGQIDRLRRLAPGAALMLLGPPDAMSPDGGGLCEGPAGGARWRNPPTLALVRDVQRQVAADTGVAFWDWRMAMGGDCSAHRLATAAEPLMRGDHVHFNSAGGDWIGRLLFDDLMAAREAWRAGRASDQDQP